MTKHFKVLLALLSLLTPVKANGTDLSASNDLFIRTPITLVSKEANLSITTSKVARLYGHIDKDTYYKFNRDIVDTRHLPGDRIVLINSRGGEVSFGKRMIEKIKAEQLQGTRIVCFVEREASSMAFNFLTACDVRLMHPEGRGLFHKIERAELKNIGRLTARNLRLVAKDLENDDKEFDGANAKAMGLSQQDYDIFADNETDWNAQDLLARGYLHGYGKIKN